MSKRSFKIEDHVEAAADHTAAEAVATDRFQHAKRVVARQPSGLSPVTPAEAPAARATRSAGGDAPIKTAVANVLDNPFNARQNYKEKRIVELSASISQYGQLAPALACEISNVTELLALEGADSAVAMLLRPLLESASAQYLLIGGHYRKKAIARQAAPEIELKLIKVASLLDLYSLSYVENDEREDTTPLDDAISWQRLLEIGVAKNHDDISKATHKPRTTIVKTLQLLKLPITVLDIFREAPEGYTLTAGYLLTQIAPKVQPHKVEELAEQVVGGTVSTRELEDMLKALDAEKPRRKARDLSRQHKIITDGAEVGVIKEWDSGRVVLDVQLLDQVQRETLVAELRRRFGVDADPSQLSLKG
jgi:ParB family transcriptional regulator, chromosome partitioning protein